MHLADIFSGHYSDDFKGVLAMVGAFTTALVAIVGGLIFKTVKIRARETTKREIAAYVAEGSMKPEDAERILKADVPRWERC